MLVGALWLGAASAGAQPARQPGLAAADSLRQLPRWSLARQLRLAQTRLLPGSPAVAVAQEWVLKKGKGLPREVYWDLELTLGRYYIDNNQPSQAVRQLLAARQHCRADSTRLSLADGWLSYSYLSLNQSARAVPFGEEAIRYSPRATPPRYVPASIYVTLAQAVDELGDKARGEQYYLKALALDKRGGDPDLIGECLLMLASRASQQGNQVRARDYLDSARVYLYHMPGNDHLNDVADYVMERETTAELALAERRYRAAELALRPLRRFLPGRPLWEGEVLGLLAPALAGQGRYREALACQERINALQATTFEATAQRQAQELAQAYAASQREQEIAQQRQRIGRLQAQQQLRTAQYSRRLAWLGAGVLAVLLLATLAGMGWAARQRRQRAEREEKLRNRIATDLHDEVGTLLARVSMQADMLYYTQATTPGDLERLQTNARAAAGTMRDIVWGIDAQSDTAGALLDRMRDYLFQFSTPTGLATELRTHGISEAQSLSAECRQHLYLIFKEAVTNAVRHAPAATQLIVTLSQLPGNVELTVENDGPPSPPATRSGMGLRNMRQRAAALRGQLHAGPLPAGGYRVQLVLPSR